MPNLFFLHRGTFQPTYETFKEWWARVKDTPYRPQEELLRMIHLRNPTQGWRN